MVSDVLIFSLPESRLVCSLVDGVDTFWSLVSGAEVSCPVLASGRCPQRPRHSATGRGGCSQESVMAR